MPGPILVVDDDEAVRVMLARLLETQGFTTARARDAAEARAVLAEQDCSLLIVDVVMPGESGLDFATYARSTYPATPIVLISGYADEEPAGFAAQHDNVVFVAKPFAADQFLGLVQGSLACHAVKE